MSPTDPTAGAGPCPQRRALATLAHAKAHEAVALSEALDRIDDGMSLGQVRDVLRQMIRTRRAQVSLMGLREAGHA